MSQGTTTRRKYTKEFKLHAVQLSNQPDVVISEVARNLGIRIKEVYRPKTTMLAECRPTSFLRDLFRPVSACAGQKKNSVSLRSPDPGHPRTAAPYLYLKGRHNES